jgi:hypothetical protein
MEATTEGSSAQRPTEIQDPGLVVHHVALLPRFREPVLLLTRLTEDKESKAGLWRALRERKRVYGN